MARHIPGKALAHTAPFPFLLDTTDRTLWRMPPTDPPTIYLTFDDGPNPTATPQLLDVLRKRLKQAGVRNVTPVLGRDDDPMLPQDRCDVAVIVNVYHHMHDGVGFLRRLASRLPRNARVINVDWNEDTEKGPPAKRRGSSRS